MAAIPSVDVLHDPGRLAALRRTGLVDSEAEVSYDRIGELARRILGVPVALVSLVDADRQYFKCALGLPEPWQGRRETPLTHSICRHALESTEPLRVDDATTDPRLIGNLAPTELGALAYLGVPLRSSDGYGLGTFCVIDTVPRQWTDDEVAVVADLAVFVESEIALREALGDREANARREARRRRQAEALFDLAELLSTAASVGEIVAAVAATGGGPVDADFINIGLVRPATHGAEVEIRHAATLAPEIGDRWPRVPLDETTPIGAAIHRGERIVLASPEEIRSQFPFGADDSEAAGFRALAAVPLRDGSGAIGFAWRRENPLGRAASRMLGTVSDLIGQALERARLYDRERAIARELQASLLPDLSGVANVDIAARYEAGEAALDVGGDWYALVEAPDGASYTLAVGDVVGHGVEAAGAMGQLRAAFEAIALNADSLDDLIRRLDRYAATHERLRYGTAIIVDYEPARGTVETHSAGHVPMVIRRADGEIDFVRGEDPPLGFDPDLVRSTSVCRVEPGDLLVLYTDGLVERRGTSIDDGLDRLAASLATIGGASASVIADSLVATLGSAEDDAAVMVLRIG